jgi:D-3-phosphoglycerate dehydrogenase
MTRPRILIAEPNDFSPRAEAMLRVAGDVELGSLLANDDDAWRAAFAAYDVVWFRLARRITAAILSERPRCTVLATPVTGLDHIDLAACAQRNVRVVSLRGETEFLRTVRATAEHTLALTLALLRHIPAALDDVRAGEWQRDRFRGGEIFGKTVGVVGVGRLGSIVAGFMRALGARVIGFDRRADFPADVVDARAASLDDLLRASDIVTLHVSYGEATRHLIDARALAQMKPSALLINTSRGGVVDEAVLLRALESKSLAGAALDVLDGEPSIDAAHPVVAAVASKQFGDRLLVVPHIGGNTFESFEKTEVFLAGRVIEALSSASASVSASTSAATPTSTSPPNATRGATR